MQNEANTQPSAAEQPMTTAIGYCRVSTDTQETDRQKAMIRLAATASGLNLLRIIEEPADVSGRSSAAKAGPNEALAYYAGLASLNFALVERSGYGELLRAVVNHECQIVIFYALDRLSRDTMELLLLEKILAAHSVSITSIAEGGVVDTRSAAGKFVFRILAAKAELECDQTSERTSATLRRMVERGEQVGRPPIGWRAAAKTRKDEPTTFEHDPALWPLVERVRILKSENKTYADIAAITAAEGRAVSASRVKAYLDAYNWVPPGTAKSTAPEPAQLELTAEQLDAEAPRSASEASLYPSDTQE